MPCRLDPTGQYKHVPKDTIHHRERRESRFPFNHRSKWTYLSPAKALFTRARGNLFPQAWTLRRNTNPQLSRTGTSPAVSCCGDLVGQTRPHEGTAQRLARSAPTPSSPSSDQGLEARAHSRRPLLPTPPLPPSLDPPRHHASSGRWHRRRRPHHRLNWRPHPDQTLGDLARPTTQILPRRAAAGTARVSWPASPASAAKGSFRGTICALHRTNWCGAVGAGGWGQKRPWEWWVGHTPGGTCGYNLPASGAATGALRGARGATLVAVCREGRR